MKTVLVLVALIGLCIAGVVEAKEWGAMPTPDDYSWSSSASVMNIGTFEHQQTIYSHPFENGSLGVLVVTTRSGTETAFSHYLAKSGVLSLPELI